MGSIIEMPALPRCTLEYEPGNLILLSESICSMAITQAATWVRYPTEKMVLPNPLRWLTLGFYFKATPTY